MILPRKCGCFYYGGPLLLRSLVQHWPGSDSERGPELRMHPDYSTHTRARAAAQHAHARHHARSMRAPRARARQVRVCIEALKPSLQNGGRGFKASMQKVAFTICPYYMLHYEFVRSRDGIQGYGYGTVPRYGMVPYVPVPVPVPYCTVRYPRKCEFYISTSVADVT